MEFLLGAAPALVQGVPGKADDMERFHHCRRGWEFLAGGGLGPGESVHRDHLNPIAPRLGALYQSCFGAASITSSNLAGPVPARTASSAATRTGHEPAAG